MVHLHLQAYVSDTHDKEPQSSSVHQVATSVPLYSKTFTLLFQETFRLSSRGTPTLPVSWEVAPNQLLLRGTATLPAYSGLVEFFQQSPEEVSLVRLCQR
jgi:hypothetical protein